MISVIQVYNTVRDIANKDQKGFVTPEMFNSLLPAVQSNIFSKIFDYAVQAKALKRSGSDLGGEDSLYVKSKNYLSEYIVSKDLTGDTASLNYDDAYVFEKPIDCNKIISIFTTEGVNIDLVYNTEKMSRIINSNLSKPTETFPVALISNKIEIFPDSITTGVIMNYYRNPSSRYEAARGSYAAGDIDATRQPFYSALSYTNNITAPSVLNCRAFDLPYEFFGEVVSEICKMIGVSLRDTFLTQYGAAPQV